MNTAAVIWIVITTVVVIHIILLISFSIKRRSNKNDEVATSKIEQNETLVHSMFGVIYLMFIIGGIINALNPERKFLMNLSVSMVITWMIILIGYYAWAIYFYNINLGWSDEKWQRFRKKQKDGPVNDQVSPEKNPYLRETFGLPPGTVRGTIALSLVVLAMALAITSLNLDTTVRSNTTQVDHFDFLKQAFLMMIAFYFGSKSLEILQNKPSGSADDKPKPPDGDGKDKGEEAPQDFRDVMAEG